jgi:hypothetical protein
MTDLLACAECAIAVPDGRVTESRNITEIRSPSGRDRGPERIVDLSTCGTCRANADRIEQLLHEHPALRRARGPAGATRALQNVVTALGVLQQPAPAADVPDADLGALIHHLSEPGARLSWRFQATGGVAPYRYSFVREDQLDAVRQAYGAYLHERTARSAPPARIPPPKGHGCMFCGVGVVLVTAATVARQGRDLTMSRTWRDVHTTVTSLGRDSPDRAVGCLCPTCSEAHDVVGSIGQTAMARALATHLREAGAAQVAWAVEDASKDNRIRLVGWGALPSGEPPNDRPWQHLDLSALTE